MSDCRFGVSPVNYPDPDPDPDLFSVNVINYFCLSRILCNRFSKFKSASLVELLFRFEVQLLPLCHSVCCSVLKLEYECRRQQLSDDSKSHTNNSGVVHLR